MTEQDADFGNLKRDAEIQRLQADLDRTAAELDAQKRRAASLQGELDDAANQLRVAIERAETKSRDLDQLIHDLRSTLSAISTWAEIFRDPSIDEKTRADGVRILSLSAAAQSDLLAKLQSAAN
jgi:signal transduction histidine kinase